MRDQQGGVGLLGQHRGVVKSRVAQVRIVGWEENLFRGHREFAPFEI
jgi:hypothetical protein